MAITPKLPGVIDTPNTIPSEAAGVVDTPNPLAAEAAGVVDTPNPLTAEAVGVLDVPNSLAAEAAGVIDTPNPLTSKAVGVVDTPNPLTAQTPAAFPRALTPTVDINYASGLFAQNGAGIAEADLITYSRGSSATFVDRQLSATNTYEYFVNTEATGNIQRIEYDAATGESLGALIESASTNLALRSEEFDNASWIKADSSISADATQAPDTETTADKLATLSTGTKQPQIRQTITSISATNYTVSAYIKRAEASFIQIFFETGHVNNDPRVNFDLSNGTIGTQDADIDAASIIPVGNDWFRISATVEAVGVALNSRVVIIKASTDTRSQTNSWTAGDGLYIWGAQIEQQRTATSYIPTTSATVSRLADLVSIPTLGNVPDGDVTFFTVFKAVARGAISYIYDIATNASQIDGFIATNRALTVRHGSALIAVASANTWDENSTLTTVFDRPEDTVTGYLNGVLTVSQAAGDTAIINTAGVVGIGQTEAMSSHLNGHIKRFTIYSEALTAQEVALL